MKTDFFYLALPVFALGNIQNLSAKEVESTASRNKPNIVFILADDMGYGDVSTLNPSSKIRTSNIDDMACNGILFTDAHTSSSVSTPSRYSILTGRYNWRSTLKKGVLSGYSRTIIPDDRRTMADMLKDCGYSTACIGKWHLGWSWGLKDGINETNERNVNPTAIDFTKPIKHGPSDCGFDYFYGIVGSLDMPPYVYVENTMPTEVPDINIQRRKGWEMMREGKKSKNFSHETCLENITDKAIEYINSRSSQTKPFFLYLPLPAPHTPILPSKEFVGKSGIGVYGDYTLMVDNTVGRVRRALKNAGLSSNTIVVFTADNGCSPVAGLVDDLKSKGHNPNGILRGSKADLFEGGHRVPLLVEWPGVKSMRCDKMVCLMDFYSTFASLNNYKLNDNEGEDSFSMLPLFENAEKDVRDILISHSVTGEFAIRKGEWKLLMSPSSGGWSYPRPGVNNDVIKTLPKVQLYNLREDIEEINNVYDKYPEIVKELKETLLDIIEKGRSTQGKEQKNDFVSQWNEYNSLLSM